MQSGVPGTNPAPISIPAVPDTGVPAKTEGSSNIDLGISGFLGTCNSGICPTYLGD